MTARKQLWVMTLWAATELAQGQTATENSGYGPIVWPKERQHELAGHYTGTLRDHECGNMTAQLALDEAHRYVLTVHCTEQESPTRTLRGDWWIDEIAGSCLILDKSRDEVKMFGFRISDDANLLSLDGGDCTAANERNWPHTLKRTDRK